MSKIFVANWKMNPGTLEEAKNLFAFYIEESQKYPKTRVVVCPPFVYLEELSKQLGVSGPSLVSLGAQDVFWEESGAFTGEISTKQLNEFGVKYVLVGHSERRALGETDEMINKKLLKVLEAGMTPILLVGEKEKSDYREDILIDQLANDFKDVSAEDISKVFVTYEPVWAISSHSGGQSDTPENAVQAISEIKNILARSYKLEAISYLYGGSVNSSNIESFLSHPEISGVVVGSASLKKDEISKILSLTK